MAKRRGSIDTRDTRTDEPASAKRTSRRAAMEKESSNGEGQHGREGAAPDAAALDMALSGPEFNARVARKAFELFERRGRGDGNDVQDWLEAERIVKEEIEHERRAGAR
ncbi:DUF2934 domain-containing protein [Candidatus Nitrospira bockiana]